MKTKRQNLFKLGKVLILVLLSAFYGCKNDKEELTPAESGAEVPVEINLQSASFEDAEAVTPRALSAKLAESANIQEKQIQQIKLNNNINLVAEMVPVNDTEIPQKRASANSTKSVTYTVQNLTKYTILVFQSETDGGKFVKAQNYNRSAEQFGNPLKLNPGTYQFVAISLNRSGNTDYPSYIFTSQDSTLANCQVNISSNTDFMSEVQSKTITGNGTNTLNINFHHVPAQVNVTLDASALGQQITLVEGAYLENSMTNAHINLKTGTYGYTGTSANVALSFPLPATSPSGAVIYYPQTKFAPARLPKLVIPKMAIGNEPPFLNIAIEGFNLEPGYRYQLKITLTPSDDKTGIYMGLPVARIGGRIWMRHNLGADYLSSPDDVTPSILFPLWGNYYQWGTNVVLAIKAGPALFNYRPIPPVGYANAWNSTSISDIPTKSNVDPCPIGFRVPTSKEFQALMANTNVTQQPVNPWTEQFTSQVSFLILTSKSNSNVKLTLPATGNWDEFMFAFRNRYNVRVALWTSTADITNEGAAVYNYERSFSAPVITENIKTDPTQIRCIAQSINRKIDILPD